MSRPPDDLHPEGREDPRRRIRPYTMTAGRTVPARLGIPVNVTRILVDDLSDEGLVVVHAPAARGAKPSVELLERVLQGLRAL